MLDHQLRSACQRVTALHGDRRTLRKAHRGLRQRATVRGHHQIDVLDQPPDQMLAGMLDPRHRHAVHALLSHSPCDRTQRYVCCTGDDPAAGDTVDRRLTEWPCALRSAGYSTLDLNRCTSREIAEDGGHIEARQEAYGSAGDRVGHQEVPGIPLGHHRHGL
jgi:hypothetical protein